jgi:ABC-type polysaccharide/polyol phosphate transport system ATPase subunit
MDKFWDGDVTVLVVSHDLEFIKQSCQKAIWLDKGQVKFSDHADNTVINYLSNIQYK